MVNSQLMGCKTENEANFVVRLAADNNLYLQLTVEKMHVLGLFSDKYSRPYRCSDILRLWLTVQIQKLKY